LEGLGAVLALDWPALGRGVTGGLFIVGGFVIIDWLANGELVNCGPRAPKVEAIVPVTLKLAAA
jgi:hypothetical protein